MSKNGEKIDTARLVELSRQTCLGRHSHERTPLCPACEMGRMAREILELRQHSGCKYGDPFCPCQDGDMCHYEGPNPMTPPNATRQRKLAEMERGDEERSISIEAYWQAKQGEDYGSY